jgi:hypothetical protein
MNRQAGGQPAPDPEAASDPEQDPLDEIGQESFPASDPPSFTTLTAGPPARTPLPGTACPGTGE